MLEEGITWDSFYANFIEHYIWYHAFSLTTLLGILLMIGVHHVGS